MAQIVRAKHRLVSSPVSVQRQQLAEREQRKERELQSRRRRSPAYMRRNVPEEA